MCNSSFFNSILISSTFLQKTFSPNKSYFYIMIVKVLDKEYYIMRMDFRMDLCVWPNSLFILNVRDVLYVQAEIAFDFDFHGLKWFMRAGHCGRSLWFDAGFC